MPKPNPPPTPGSSSDIRGKEGGQEAPRFDLPPTAYLDAEQASTASAESSANGSDSSYRPVSPASPAKLSRKRTMSQTGSVVTKDDFALPPPPTRSRKIIQMKPRESEKDEATSSVQLGSQQASKTQGTPQSSGRKKQNNNNSTAAGRKIARKTAHSLIERRRRSKMNEEFGVLKDMVPACTGQEMHKLAILQASIEYLRYLEQCVSDLQAQNSSPRLPPPTFVPTSQNSLDDNDNEDEEMEDEQGGETAVSTPSTAPRHSSSSLVSLPPLSQMTSTATTSPSVFSSAGRHFSVSSSSQPGFSPYFHSNQPSPAFGPQISHFGPGSSHYAAARDNIGLGSPALGPTLDPVYGRSNGTRTDRSQSDPDQEATAALLMLNTDRRKWAAPATDGRSRGGTGMSVRDLLSG